MMAAAMGAVAFQKGLGAIHALASDRRGLQHPSRHDQCRGDGRRADDMNRPDRRPDRRAAAYLGIDGGFDGFYDFVLKLRADLGVPDKLSALGVGRDRIDEMTAMALEDPSAGGNPVT
jgi:alcohol dehydrogenase